MPPLLLRISSNSASVFLEELKSFLDRALAGAAWAAYGLHIAQHDERSILFQEVNACCFTVRSEAAAITAIFWPMSSMTC